ncbi:hypothetical protein WEH80_25970 [Actinomycetes bacterium KLBMP 9759]
MTAIASGRSPARGPLTASDTAGRIIGVLFAGTVLLFVLALIAF